MTKEEERRIRAIDLALEYKKLHPELSEEDFMLIVDEFFDYIKFGRTPKGN